MSLGATVMSLSNGITVVVPVYNSDRILAALVSRIKRSLVTLGGNFELILVNDGSCDGSWDVICRQAADYERVIGVDLASNYGQQAALLCGIRLARFNTTVTMDDDLQNPPEEIPRLIEKLDQGYQVVYGVPRVSHRSIWRRVVSALVRPALRIASFGLVSFGQVGAFRAFHTELREAFKNQNSSCIPIDVLLSWGAKRFAAVVVEKRERTVGESGYTFKRLFRDTFMLLNNFAPIFLRLVISLAVLGVTGVLMALWICFFRNSAHTVGMPTEYSAILGFVTLLVVEALALGCVGEYLVRFHLQALGRPSYIIRQQRNAS